MVTCPDPYHQPRRQPVTTIEAVTHAAGCPTCGATSINPVTPEALQEALRSLPPRPWLLVPAEMYDDAQQAVTLLPLETVTPHIRVVDRLVRPLLMLPTGTAVIPFTAP